MSRKLLFTCCLIFFTTNLLLGQKSKEKIIDKSGWQFVQMILHYQGFMREALDQKDITYLLIAEKYLNWAQNNLSDLQGAVNEETFKLAADAMNIYYRLVDMRLNRNIESMIVQEIADGRIFNFTKQLFCQQLLLNENQPQKRNKTNKTEVK